MMACPDELTLDLWMAGALPEVEAAVVAEHVQTCATCSTVERAARVATAELHAALELDEDELAYLSGLELASNFEASTSSVAHTSAWSWIALAGVVAGFTAWLLVGPTIGSAVDFALELGVGSVLLDAALVLVFSVGQALLEVIRNPLLGQTQPLFVLLALALLFWPRQLIPQRSARS